MKFKVINDFTHPKGGWSELYYVDAADDSASYNQGLAIANGRATLLAQPARLTRMRISRELPARGGSLTRLNLLGSSNLGASDTPYQCVLVRLYNTPNAKQRPLFVRGIADDVYLDTNNVTFNLFRQQIFNWVTTAVIPSNVYIKYKTITPNNYIDTVAPLTANDRTLITCNLPHLCSPGDYVTVYKMTGLPRPMGLVRVLSAPTGSSLVVKFWLPAGFVYQTGAYLRKYVADYYKVDTSNVGDVTHRIVGSPSDLSRGRRRSIPK